MDDRQATHDINRISCERFVSFIFDRPAPELPDDEPHRDQWYYHVDVAFNPGEVLEHYINLFTDPGFLRSRYSRGQLEQGFWAIQSSNLDCSAQRVIWAEQAQFGMREACVQAMFHLFERLFADDPLGTAASMWWDSFCYDWHCGNRSRENGGEDRIMQDVMFDTLSKILALNSLFCQGAALHGLGHLHHPDTAKLVTRYLQLHPALSEDMKKYARAAARFEIM